MRTETSQAICLLQVKGRRQIAAAFCLKMLTNTSLTFEEKASRRLYGLMAGPRENTDLAVSYRRVKKLDARQWRHKNMSWLSSVLENDVCNVLS